MKKKLSQQEQITIDQREFQLRFRAAMISDAQFLLYKAEHRLQEALRQYPDLSKDPDFDESRDIGYCLKFVEMAIEEIANGGYDIPYRDRLKNEQEYQDRLNNGA